MLVDLRQRKSKASIREFVDSGASVVKSNICPVCLADIQGEYVEEGDLRISDEAITCPNCGFTLQGVVDECPELEEFDKEKGIGL